MTSKSQIESILNESEARANAATEGPWAKCTAHEGKCSCLSVWSIPADSPVVEAVRRWGDGIEGTDLWLEYGQIPEDAVQANKTFIAAARTEVPSLTAALRVAVEVLENQKCKTPDCNSGVCGEINSAISEILAKLK